MKSFSKTKAVPLFLFIFWLLFYSYFQTSSIYGGDAGDLVTAAYVHGVPHPPGYPLYTFLGFLLTKIPLSTVAWRVGLISSFSAAATLTVFYLLLYGMSKMKILSVLTVCYLGLTYLFWLYAIVPEVFALNNLFAIVLTYFLFKWIRTRNKKYFYFFVFFIGLSLTHHHIIILLFPAFGYMIFNHRKLLPHFSFPVIIKTAGLFILGLLPYIYVYIAALSKPPINWENPINLQKFIRLVTRAGYGTFQLQASSSENTLTFFGRLSQIVSYENLVKQDFLIIGLILMLLGALYQWKNNRKHFIFTALAVIISGPFFSIYANFPLNLVFDVAVFERFLLASYLFLSVWLLYGLFVSRNFILKVFKLLRLARVNQYNKFIYLFFLVFPLLLFYINSPKLSLLKNDRTAEHFAKDLLGTVPQNSVIFPNSDTLLFDMQYMHYVEKYRPDIALLHVVRAADPINREALKKEYPQLKFPDIESKKSNKDFLTRFIENNYNTLPIYTFGYYKVPIDGEWIQEGLLTRFYKKKDIPNKESIINFNENLWNNYHDPLSGNLAHYYNQNMMLSDVLLYYLIARMNTGKLFYNLNNYVKAEEQFKKLVPLDPQNADIYYWFSYSQFKLKKCDSAFKNAESAINLNNNNYRYYSLLSMIYKECMRNNKMSEELKQKSDNLKKKQEVKMENL